MNVPKLRFNSYKDEWKSQKLKDVCSFSKGKDLSKADLSEEGEPCILYGELYTKYGAVIDKVISKTEKKSDSLIKGQKHDVLIPSSGESAIDIACASSLNVDSALIGGDLNILRPNNDVNGHFLSYQINGKRKEKLSTLAQGATVTHLYAESIKKLECFFPTINEQEQIAKFIFTFDKKIQLQQEKIDLLKEQKKGYMQKVFNQELKFKGIEGQNFAPWKEKKIAEFIEEHKELSIIENEYPILTSSRNGLVLQSEHFKSQVTTNNNIGYHVIPKGYFTFRSRSDDGNFTFNINNIIDKGIVSYFYPVFKVININPVYFHFYINNYLQKEIKKEIVGTSQLVLSLNKLKDLTIQTPTKEEQDKIADLISHFDKKISLEITKLSNLSSHKQAFMQQMFI